MAQQPLFLQDNYYQKRMVKVFKSLNEHKLDKAAKYWEDIKNKAVKDKDIEPNVEISKQLFPLWQLSECMMMNIRDGRGKSTQCLPFDPWGAYDLLRQVYRDTYDIASADLFFADEKGLKLTVADIKGAIEHNLIDSVRFAGTEAAYDKIIDVLFDCRELSTLKDEREHVAYERIKHLDDLERCQQYLDKYKDQNKSHFSVIEWRRDSHIGVLQAIPGALPLVTILCRCGAAAPSLRLQRDGHHCGSLQAIPEPVSRVAFRSSCQGLGRGICLP